MPETSQAFTNEKIDTVVNKEVGADPLLSKSMIISSDFKGTSFELPSVI